MKRSPLLSVLTITTLLFSSSRMANAAESDFRKGFSGVATQARPAVVFIQVEKQIAIGGGQLFFNNPYELFDEGMMERFGMPRSHGHKQPQRRQQPQQMYKQTGQGSGFLISKDGFILTNTHVVGDAEKITVRLMDGREFIAKRIGADSKTEVALIKIEGKDFPCLSIGNPTKLDIGEWVIAIGNPFGLKETLTVGVVSAKGRNNMGITDYEDFIQTDAAINPGNSGGPLLNIDGEVIGINTAIFSQNGGTMGIGFAVPIDMAMQVKEQLVSHGKVTRGYIGIYMNPEELNEQMAQSFGYKEKSGVLIADVQKDGPADKAGLLSGDIIMELNDKKIQDPAIFRRTISTIAPAQKAKLLIFRDGKTKTITVTVERLPEEGGSDTPAEVQEGSLEKYGLQIQNLTPDLAKRFPLDSEDGVIVSEVEQGSSAAEAGLQPGMLIVEINRKKVSNTRQFLTELKKSDKRLLLRVKSERGTFFITLKAD
ncbi:MAG: Do family serine endopeptidase [bacterium]